MRAWAKFSSTVFTSLELTEMKDFPAELIPLPLIEAAGRLHLEGIVKPSREHVTRLNE